MEHNGSNTGDGRLICPGDQETIQPEARPFSVIQECERKQIETRRRVLGVNAPGEVDLGLAISGGGIRSATFSLGILQRLADEASKCRILKHVDYISTVSGGGYIGSWLCSWIRRSQVEPDPQKATGLTREKPPSEAEAFEQVCKDLSPTTSRHSATETDLEGAEAEQITFLREYSNYLTPRVSVFSADTWAVAAIWSRNTLLNISILVAIFGLAVLLARSLGKGIMNLLSDPGDEFGCALVVSIGLLVPMILLIAWNLNWSSKYALDRCPPPDRNDEQTDSWVIWFCIFPLLSAISYSLWLSHAREVFVLDSLWHGVRANFYATTVAYFVIQLSARVYQCHLAKKADVEGKDAVDFGTRLYAASLYVIAPPAAGFVTAALLRAVAFLFDVRHDQPDQPWLVLTFGPPLVLLAFAIGVVVHVGLMGRDLPEASREWLGRLRAWLMVFTFFWVIIFSAAIYGPWLVAWIGVKSTTAITGLSGGWILSTIGGLLAGKSSKTSGKGEEETKAKGFSWPELAAKLGPYLFMAGFALSVAFGVHAILVHNLPPKTPPAVTQLSEKEKYDLQVRNDQVQLSREKPEVKDTGFQWILSRYWVQLTNTEFWVKDTHDRWVLSGLLALGLLLLVGGGLLTWRVDVNNFSMHNFYKNRLVRCYLGASRQKRRKPNPFTGFDDRDDTDLDLFTYQPDVKGSDKDKERDEDKDCDDEKRKYIGPYPIWNAALNVSSGGKLQYQERQAQSYIFTPLYTGFSIDTVADEMRLGDSASGDLRSFKSTPSEPGGYRPTRRTGGRISVGMAMAISGAAVNPNMGYHTSTAVSFLLTVFNVRLGWWLGNTLKDKTFSNSGPAIGLMYTFRELFGMANADSSYVNLSDGGHFDNMGIYELVRRRCRYIICCDGEQDAGPNFGGIGNAIRKCRTDFGVEIDLPVERMRKVDGFSRVHCAVGKIKYPDTEGYIVYLKSSLTGDEPTDILAYRSEHLDFPQQTTGDQWFDESQFESYRKLGYHIADRAFSSADCALLRDGNREEYFKSLYQIWYPPSAAVDEKSGKHSDIYATILEAVRKSNLKSLDPSLFEGFNAASGWDHDAGHICNALIQLMERIFYDLGLEDRSTREHPFVDGWMKIFRYWVKQDAFKDTWAQVKKSYPERFRAFYESL